MTWVKEVSREEVQAVGCRTAAGAYPNACLVDSCIHYYRLSESAPDANWKGIFVLAKGVNELGSGHALLVYIVGGAGWAYDPEGREVRFLGPIDPQSSQSVLRLLDPEAQAGGWLLTEDIAWVKRHGGGTATTESR